VRVPLPHKDLTEYAQAGGNVAGWLDDVTGSSELEDAVITWAEAQGYTVSLGTNGHWIAARDE
jgi:hypothetical protein